MKTWETKNGYVISRILSGRSNVFLISGNDKNFLIDTSPGWRWNKLKESLNKPGMNNINFLILTHTHFDHAANAAKLKREFGVKVIVNKEEASFLEKGQNIIPEGTNFFTFFLVKTLAPIQTYKLNYEPCKPDILVDQYFDLNIFGLNAYIIHTPGHSPGSQSVIVDNEIAIVGDAMFGVFPRSVFPPFTDNKNEMIKSWAKLIQTNCTLFLPSHGTANKVDLVKREYLIRNYS